MTLLDVPTTLPVAHLSVSSLKTYLDCPLAWKRRYIDREYEPPNGAMLLGSSVGAAEAHADSEQIDTGERPELAAVIDEFSDDWDERVDREEVDWRGESAGEMKDQGVAAVQAYESTIGPNLRPTSVEREFELRFEGVDWTVTGFIDLEEEDGSVSDRKVKARKLAVQAANVDLQPSIYLLARRAEGNPAGLFKFHTIIRTKTPYAEIVPTVRTNSQLDALEDRLLLVASEIAWRIETDHWQGAVPGHWKCSEKWCGYWPDCKFGGLR